VLPERRVHLTVGVAQKAGRVEAEAVEIVGVVRHLGSVALVANDSDVAWDVALGVVAAVGARCVPRMRPHLIEAHRA